MGKFKVVSEYTPSGDQPQAIDTLASGIENGLRDQVLLGVTGSGKTYTMAKVIEKVQRPTLVLAHNKTLAAQLCEEFREFFPGNAVEYFVSYYDYYQPEAYLPATDTFIEKDLSINDEIEKMRLQTCATLLSGRRDVIVVSSVSCLYGSGNPEDFHATAVSFKVGDIVSVPVETKQFGRIAAQAAKQVIIQGIREAERGMIYEEFNSKEHEILTGVVTRIDPRTGNASLRIGTGTEATDALLLAGEQVKGETLVEGQRIKVYLVDVRRQSRGPQVVISRTHPGLVKRLFELEVPEIYDGTVEIRSIAREAGSRTKMAVWSNDENVDPIGACVGPHGQRVNSIVEELRGEKIDIIKYSDDPAEYIAAALAPADVVDVRLAEEGKACRVIVPDDQLSLAIGKEGQNARLAARLVGYKIDIKPESYKEEE